MRRIALVFMVLLAAVDARAQYDGTWSGTTAQGKAIALEISAGAIRKLILAARVEAVGCAGNITETINTVVTISSNGTFNYQSGAGTPTTWMISGSLSSVGEASGSLSARVNFAPVPGICQGSALTTWTASKGGAPQPGAWTPLSSGVTSSLGGIDVNSGVAIATGGTATILRSADGGQTWTRAVVSALGTDRCCYNARFSSPSVIWVVGIRAVLRSTNAGQSFGGTQYTDSSFRNAIFPVSDTVAWAVGGNTGMRTFYRYTMSGTTMSEQLWAATSQDFMRDIFFVNANTGWAVGSPGRIIKITNASGEPLFATQQSGTSVILNGVFMLDELTGWVVGDGGRILRTTNGGATWSTQFSGTTNDLQKIAFKDRSNGIIVGDAGTILTTSDAGGRWEIDTSGTSVDLRHVHFDSPAAHVVGASGTILKKSTVTKRKRGAKR